MIDYNLERNLRWMNLIHLGTVNKQESSDAGKDIKIQVSEIYSDNRTTQNGQTLTHWTDVSSVWPESFLSFVCSNW